MTSVIPMMLPGLFCENTCVIWHAYKETFSKKWLTHSVGTVDSEMEEIYSYLYC